MIQIHKLLLILFISAGYICSLHAEVLPAFFNQDGARTVFEGPIETTITMAPQMLPPKQLKNANKENNKQAVSNDNNHSRTAHSAHEIKHSAAQDYRRDQPADRDSIINTFGSPADNYPIAAVPDAPGPFKGMLAALNAGDEELAFKYAIQYSRYQEKVKENNNKVVAFLGQAMRREGYLPSGSWPDSPDYQEYAHLQEKKLKGFDTVKATEQENIKSSGKTIQKAAHELIARLKAGDHDLFNENSKSLQKELGDIELAERQKVRQELSGKVPNSVDGKLDVYLFFRSSDAKVSDLLAEVNELHNKNTPDSKLNIAGFVLDEHDRTTVLALVNSHKIIFPILPGDQLGRSLGLTQTPVIIFTNSTGQAHIENGYNSYFRLDELIKMMRGL